MIKIPDQIRMLLSQFNLYLKTQGKCGKVENNFMISERYDTYHYKHAIQLDLPK